jgi:hypothetical protein
MQECLSQRYQRIDILPCEVGYTSSLPARRALSAIASCSSQWKSRYCGFPTAEVKAMDSNAHMVAQREGAADADFGGGVMK